MASPFFLFLLELTTLFSGTREHKCSLSEPIKFCPGTMLYAYDDSVGECKLRKSLCQGTPNTFSSLRDCEAHCTESGVPAQCLLPKSIGPCHGLFFRFYYNSTLGDCEKFDYGGCGSNANNFVTLKECQKTCKVSNQTTKQKITVASANNGIINATNLTLPEYRALRSAENSTVDNRNSGTPILQNPTNAKKTIESFSNANPPTSSIPTRLLSNVSGPTSSPLADGYGVKPTGSPSGVKGLASPFLAGSYKVTPNGLPSDASGSDSSILADGYKVNPTGLPTNASEPTSYIPPIDAANISGVAEKISGNTPTGPSKNITREKRRLIDNESTLYEEGKYRYNSTRENGDRNRINVCNLPNEHGPCDLDRVRYYYSQKSKKCRLFIYGGCNGNGNNFETIGECVSRCEPNRCTHSQQVGICNQHFKRYFYDSKTKSCLSFIYSGCGGNSNNFPTFRSCQNSCVTQKYNQTHDKNTSYSVCELKPEEKDCPQSPGGLRFYYNSSTGRCMNFKMGKCGSDNGNNFHSFAECQKTCGANACELPRIPSSCGSMNDRNIYYDIKTDSCKSFVKGVCGANLNSFADLQQCENKCVKDICKLNHDSGMCLAYFRKYYYNHKAGQCHSFIYGGCGGNENRFDTIEVCQERCQVNAGKSNSTFRNESITAVDGGADRMNICSLPHDTGPCRANYPRYYYNTTLGKCTKFAYGGCKGNANNFISMTDCQQACPNTSVNVCSLPRDIGPCRANYPRYYYNSTLGKCTKFAYGGCKGNANNFISMTDCQQACPNTSVNVCSLPRDTGPCRANYPRYYYNSTLGKCTKFVYGGCKGNANNFISMTDCQQACPNTSVNVCSLPRDTGPCRANYPRYYYNTTLGKCTNFSYGGCKGNANNFISMTDCQQACPNTSVNVCSLPRDTGPCRANYPRYYYNTTLGKCTKFVYGGCKGNANNFISMTDCQQACPNTSVNVCSLPRDTGPCRANYPRYYYNTTLGKCTKFVYGGCKGNANNFISMTDCQQACPNTSVNVCSLPRDTGPCRANYPRYYYNSTLGKCTNFSYGGCKGNANNFISMTDCQQACPNTSVNVCSLPRDTGPCRANYPRYYYNTTLGKCTNFSYGGCKGNANNFISMTDCQQACPNTSVNVCSLPRDTGPCRANYPRYYYNTTLGKCTKFVYGGCKGNANNFISMTDCQQACPNTSVNVCSLPRDTGPCRANYPRYYYNTTLGKCTKFVYGGCKGNANNFISMTDCQQACPNTSVNVCSLPRDTGPCRANYPRYYYNSTLGKCTNFSYGGCKGNANNFISMTDCQQACPNTSVNVCSLPRDTGPCRANYPRYYYNSTLGKCTNFSYGGCKGNANNFISMTDCQQACPNTSVNVCSLPRDTGPCRANYPRYYYNTTLGKCTKFVYGGCKGNANNFISMTDCQQACPNTSVNVCSLPRDTGPCRANYPRYYYNTTLGKCTKFVYGGCKGNANNFISMTDCQQACPNTSVNVCSLPRDTGPCRANHPRYYYNTTLGKCIKFVYGGCKGNANNFISMTDCQQACPNTSVNVCSLPRDTGPCRANYTRYYYNSTLGKCTKFAYGGCKGNANNFISMTDCQQACPNTSVNVCSLPTDSGPCQASHQRYYYNSHLGKCSTFIYGGCQGNANNFLTMKHCQQTCLNDPCDQPLKIGPCKSMIRRFYFNSLTNNCESFNYGGCGANKNNFKTAEECQKQCARDPCSLSPDAGICNHSHMRFYFDLATGRCLNFTYSGCGGNANRFSSVTQCREKCIQNRCEKDMDAGGCDKNLTRFFYDSKSSQCVSFLYGGCGGNTNNFQSAKLCKDACHNDNLCLQPKMPGPCGAIFRRFYYDSVEGKCLEFDYGGCQGNKNNFHSLSKCQNTCTPKRIVNKCHLQIDHGHCSSSEQRFYYNSTLGSCEPFIYTGCAGNGNNFLSERQCERECKFDRCKQPRIVGGCAGNERRWYFDETFQLCRPFNYRGCGGNHNNFPSLENCEHECVAPACRLEMSTGSCNQSLHRFYYNWEHGRCYQFNYTGCHGNENRFLSINHCEETCSIDPCLQPLSNFGHCSRRTKKYFYNRKIGACQSFTFWGCQKNGNNFDNVIECHKSCQHMYEFDRRR